MGYQVVVVVVVVVVVGGGIGRQPAPHGSEVVKTLKGISSRFSNFTCS